MRNGIINAGSSKEDVLAVLTLNLCEIRAEATGAMI